MQPLTHTKNTSTGVSPRKHESRRELTRLCTTHGNTRVTEHCHTMYLLITKSEVFWPPATAYVRSE